MIRISLFDDEKERVDDYCDNIEQTLENIPGLADTKLERINKQSFLKNLTELEIRRATLREGKKINPQPCEFDDTDILILDHDLMKTDIGRGFLTADDVSYLARCFSGCKVIVGMNKYGMNSFDLTLRGDIESFVDLEVGSAQIHNPGLWSKNYGSYRPWSWPLLPKMLKEFESKVAQIKKRMPEAILNTVGIYGLSKSMPRTCLSFLGDRGRDSTSDDFMSSSDGAMTAKDRVNARLLDEEGKANIVAARISKWIETCILPAQNLIMDAPHLVYRFPSLLEGDDKSVLSWNKTAVFGPLEMMGIKYQSIKTHLCLGDWVSRPAWNWQGIMGSEDVIEVRHPSRRVEPDFVFCEDTSSFHMQEQCREFVADLESVFKRRYVKTIKGIEYRPGIRFLVRDSANEV